MTIQNELILAGKISSAHGIKGEVKLYSYLDTPENFKIYKNFYKKDGSSIEFIFVRPQDNFAIIRMKDISDRTSAEKLKGLEIYIKKSDLKKPAKDQYYYQDLIGLEVRLASGEKIGVLQKVDNYGAGDIVEIFFSGSGKAELFSFTKQNFPEINVEEKYIVIDTPEEIT